MIQIDIWSGDIHQTHAGTKKFERWKEAAAFIEEMIECGFLCNVLHTDFKCPRERVNEAERKLKSLLR